MAQTVSRGGTHPAQTAVVTVADLLNRNAPVPLRRTDDDANRFVANRFVSVSSLLRREGRSPRSTPQPWPCSPKPARSYRNSAIAAGALLAVGSAFGMAALTASPSSETEEPRVDAYPGQVGLDLSGRAPAAQPVTVIDSAAVTARLDPATAAPTSWITVGFPSPQTARSVPAAPGAPAATAVPGRSPDGGFAPPPATPPPATAPPATALPATPPPATALPATALPATALPATPPPGRSAPSAAVLGPAVDSPAAAPAIALGATVNTVTEPVITAVAPAAGGLLGGVGGLLGG